MASVRGALLPDGSGGLPGVVLIGAGFPVLVLLGLLLLGVGVVILLASSEATDRPMPTQVLPQRLALYPLMAGAATLLLATMLWLLP